MIAALAFVPLDRVIEHFEQLQEHVSDAVTRVLDYFEDNYVGRPLRHGRRPPIFVFAHSLWNMYARTDAQLPRTIIQLKAGIAVFRLALVATTQIFGDF